MASKLSLRQIFKSLSLFVLLSVSLFGVLSPLLVSSVSAAAVLDPVSKPTTPGALFYTYTPSKQAVVYTSITLALNGSCDFGYGNGGAGISEADIASGKWFVDSDSVIGFHVKPDNGKINCNNEKNWFSTLLNDAGFGGDYVAPAVQVFKRDSFGKYQIKADSKTILRNIFQDKFFGGGGIPNPALDYTAYAILYSNFIADQACAAVIAPTEANARAKLLGDNKKIVSIFTYDVGSKTVQNQEYAYTPRNDIRVGYGTPNAGSDGKLQCDSIARELKDKKYADGIAQFYVQNANVPVDDTLAGTGAGSASDLNLNCGSRAAVIFNPLSWIACPLIEGLATVATGVDNGINNLLEINTSEAFSSGYKQAWSVVRNYALALVLISILVMVLSQALGFEFLDAYTIKKLLPRVIIAGITIAVSWELMTFLVQLTNDLGNGIQSIIYKPFGNLNDGTITLGLGGLSVVGLIGAGAFASLGVIGLLSFAATAALAALLAFAVLVLRQILIVLLIILAPVAIACYVLPNTQKVWKLWWDSFSKALLMFPLIVAFITVGRIVAATAAASGTAVDTFIAFIAYFAPYFLIPLTFKFAGGLLGNIGGFVNNKSRGGFDRLKNFRGNKAKENGQKMKNYSRFSDKTAVGRGLNTALGAGANPTNILRGRSGIRTGRQTGIGVQGAALKDDKTWNANQGDDNFYLALANRQLANRKLSKAQDDYKTEVDLNGAGTEKAMTLKASIDARQNGINAADNVASRNSNSTRFAALTELSKSGYQFDPGEVGYRQLSDTVESIVGTNQEQRSSAMNTMQYHLKGTRGDLGGINNGNGSDIKSGVRKMSNYARGQSKTDTYKGGAAAWLGAGVVDESGATGKPSEMVAGVEQFIMTDGPAGDNVASIVEWNNMLAADYASATDVNKLEIDKQMKAIAVAAENLNKGPTPSTVEQMEKRTKFIEQIRSAQAVKQRSSGIDPSLYT